MIIYYLTSINLKDHAQSNIYWDELSHIDKLKMMCPLYKLLETFLPFQYDFGMVYNSLAYEVCATCISLLIY